MGEAGVGSFGDEAADRHSGADVFRRAASDRTGSELTAMRRAIELAACGLGTTSPNPVVGCVILDAAGVVAGEGFHEYAGGPHAEICALAAAGERARGGTAVVTLEPCAHTGRTGPCTQALIAAGVRRVVAAIADPYEPAAGGAAVLRAAGVDVEIGLLGAEAARGNEAWLTYITRGRPHVTWKYAASLDGRVAAPDGSSRWITSAASRADVHLLRARSVAVRVRPEDRRSGGDSMEDAGAGPPGAEDTGSVAARNRPDGLAHRQPLRVLVDTEARIDRDARVLDAAAPTLVAVAEDAGTAHLPPTVEVLRLPRAESGGLSLTALLDGLRDREVVSVLLEGGPTLAGSFLREGLVDTVVAYIAPALVGGNGRPVVAVPLAGTIADALRLRVDDVTRFGPDLRLTARPARPSPDAERAHVPGEIFQTRS
jgi:diaminohydroxyphosphoribosylaminopyrimidine deaminase/5-amino-6-(5-phosphoribosylamino)uracil reductase